MVALPGSHGLPCDEVGIKAAYELLLGPLDDSQWRQLQRWALSQYPRVKARVLSRGIETHDQG